MINRTGEQANRPGTVPRGRPPRISRDAVLDAAVALLDRDPAIVPSLNGLARALKVTPMAIYTYFSSKDDLLQAITERLLDGLELPGAVPDDPLDAIRTWSAAMRSHFLRHPRLIDMLVWEGGHVSLGWVSRGMFIYEALTRLGLEGRDLARATLWIWHVVMGAINIEIKNRHAPQTMGDDEFGRLPGDVQPQVSLMLSLTSDGEHPESFFAYQIERALDALRLLAGENGK